MSAVSDQADFLTDVCKLIQKATELGFVVTGGELFRTPEQQQIYMKSGRSQTMNSLHLSRRAIDLNFFWQGNSAMIRRFSPPSGRIGNRSIP